MASLAHRLKLALILPMTLLWVVAVEEVVTYKVRQSVGNPWYRTSAILLLYGVGFVIAANRVTPWIKGLVGSAHRSTKRDAGTPGVVGFYVLVYAALFYVYFVMETRGVQYLLPSSWR